MQPPQPGSIFGHAFDDPFGPAPPPTPTEVAGLSTDQAIISGITKGIQAKQVALAQQEMESIGYTMDGFAEQLALALEGELNAAQWTLQQAHEQAISVLVSLLLPAVETAMSYGFVPQGAPGQGKGGKPPKRRRKPSAGPQTAPASDALPAEPGAGPEALCGPLSGRTIAQPGGAPAAVPIGETITFHSPVEGTVDITVDGYTDSTGQILPYGAGSNQGYGHDASGQCWLFNVQPTGGGGAVGPPLPPPPLPGGVVGPPLPPPPRPKPAPPPPLPPAACCPESISIKCDKLTIEAEHVETPSVNVTIDEIDIELTEEEREERRRRRRPGAPPASPPAPPPPGPVTCATWFESWGVAKPESRQPKPPCRIADVRAAYPDEWAALALKGLTDQDILDGFAFCELCQPGTRRTVAEVSAAPKTEPDKPAPASGIAGSPLPASIAACLPGDKFIRQIAGRTLRELLTEAGLLTADGKWRWYVEIEKRYLNTDKFGEQILLSAAQGGELLLSGLGRLFTLVQEWLPTISGCEGPDIATAGIVQLLVGVIERWVAHLPESVLTPWRQYAQWACPTELPSAEWANEARAHNWISQDEWRCLVRADGRAGEWQLIDTQMRAERLTADELVLLSRRGLLAQGDTLEDELKYRGWTDDLQRRYYLASQQWIPDPSEAIEWMLKDLGDPQIADRFGLWNEFQLKYRGHVREVMDWHGITEQDARHLAAAHLQSVAPTQLYEMHKRLRPGFQDNMSDEEALNFARQIAPQKPRGPGAEDELKSIAEWQSSPTYVANTYPGTPDWQARGYPQTPPYWLEEITDAVTARAYLANLITTGGIVYEGLSQARYPTFWRERLEAMSYRVLTRTDARRAYEVGTFDLAKLVEVLQDQGYTQPDAEALAGFYRESLAQQFARKPISNAWVKEGFSTDKLRRELLDLGMRPEFWDDVFARLDRRRVLQIERVCIGQIKKRFLLGHIDDQGATAQLVSISVSADRIADLIKEWSCIRRAKPKQEVAAQVTKELVSETITADTAKRLLRGAGYTPLQAARIIRAALATAATDPKTRRKIAEKLLKGLEGEGNGAAG